MKAVSRSKPVAQRKRIPRSKRPLPSPEPMTAPEGPAPEAGPPDPVWTLDRADIVRRLWRAADSQVRQIEARMQSDALSTSARESDARVLSVLSRTLRELIAMDGAESTPNERTADDDVGHLDLDSFRRELESRLQTLREQRSDRGDLDIL